MFTVLTHGLSMMASYHVLLAIFLGAVIGFIFGFIPGLGGIQALALVLPFTYGWDPIVSMFLYAGIMGSVSEGGSVSAILLNTPGTAVNAATCFDGYPMARRGEAGRALGLSISSSVLGSIFGVIVLLILIPLVKPIILAFGAPEFFWLVVFGLVTITFASRGNLFKGLAAGGMGVLLSLIGYSDVFGVLRWTGGSTYLWDGLKLVPFFIGIFAIGELITYATRGGSIAGSQAHGVTTSKHRQLLRGVWEMFRYPSTFFRGSIIGTIIGIIPGVGGSVANFISYASAMQASPNKALFGTGHPEGIIASQSAIDAKDGGALLPTLAFGIPGSAEMAVLLGALVLHGMQPGPFLLRQHPSIVEALVLGLVSAQILAGLFIFSLSNVLAKITFIRVYYIAPMVLILASVGAYALRTNIWDVGLALLAGFFGYALKRAGFPIITLVIGFILGGLAERALFQSLMIGYGSYSILFTRPICIVLISLIVLVLALPFLGRLFRKKKKAWAPSEPEAPRPFKKGPFIFSVLLFLGVAAMLVTSFQYSANAREFPLIVGIPTLIFLGISLAFEFFPGKLRALEVGIEDLWGGTAPQVGASEEEETVDPAKRRKVLQIMAWIVGFFVAVYFIGFPLASTLFVIAFLIVEGKSPPLSVVTLTVLVLLMLYVFQKAFLVDLWLGALPQAIPGILGGGIPPPL